MKIKMNRLLLAISCLFSTNLWADEVRTLDMKVMPNTPINPDRGIADPTIVVGTSSGMEAHTIMTL